MRFFLGGLALAILAGCADVKLVEPGGTSIAGVSGFHGDRWAIIRYVDKGDQDLLARRRAEASRLMREFCHPQDYVIFERERLSGSGRVRMKFRCQGTNPSPKNFGG